MLQNPNDLAHASSPEICTVVHHLKDELKQICGEGFTAEVQFSQSQGLSLPDIHASAFRTVDVIN